MRLGFSSGSQLGNGAVNITHAGPFKEKRHVISSLRQNVFYQGRVSYSADGVCGSGKEVV